MKLSEQRLKQAAEQQGLKQTDISRITGLSYSTVNQIWRGRACSKFTAEMLAAALDVPLEKLEERG